MNVYENKSLEYLVTSLVTVTLWEGRMASVSKVRMPLNTLLHKGWKTDTASNTTNTALRPLSMEGAAQNTGQGKSLHPRMLLGPSHNARSTEEAGISHNTQVTVRAQQSSGSAPSSSQDTWP